MLFDRRNIPLYIHPFKIEFIIIVKWKLCSSIKCKERSQSLLFISPDILMQQIVLNMVSFSFLRIQKSSIMKEWKSRWRWFVDELSVACWIIWETCLRHFQSYMWVLCNYNIMFLARTKIFNIVLTVSSSNPLQIYIDVLLVTLINLMLKFNK